MPSVQRAPAGQRRAPLRPDVQAPVTEPLGGAPAVQRRAPLRHDIRHIGERTRRRASAVQRRAPIAVELVRRSWTGLPPSAPAVQRRAPLRLVDLVDIAVASAMSCSRRPTAGSIAVTARCGPCSGFSCCAPAVQRRAPLRPVPGEGRQAPVRMLPPFSGALHCGSCALPIGGASARCAPAVRRRAPLWRDREPERRLGRLLCFRLSTAGSIAAAGRSSRSRTEGTCSRIKGGLHCGDQIIFGDSMAD